MKLYPIFGLTLILASGCSPDQSDTQDAVQTPEVQTEVSEAALASTPKVTSAAPETQSVQQPEMQTTEMKHGDGQLVEVLAASEETRDPEQQLRESMARLAPDMVITLSLIHI